MTASPDMPRRVALLARPGEACERLRAVLDEAGAHCVLAADPTQLALTDLLESQPQVVLVALDASTEDVLERFDPVLGDPSIDVIYEEAELAAAREGWAVARWQRHLVAKLHGHANVLPPGHEPDAPKGAIVESVARNAVAGSAAPSYAVFDPIGAEAGESFVDFDRMPAANAPLDQPASLPAASFDFEAMFDSELAEAPVAASLDFDGNIESGLSSEITTTRENLALDATAIEFDPFDPVMAELAIETLPSLELQGFESGSAAADGEISLDATAPDSAIDNAETARKFKHDLGDIQRRISTLELVDDTPRRGPEQARGAVLVLSGIGGPDAVRQLLGALPDDFARPVLVQQRLDGGRYDKLVTQLQRATALPVKLAEPGQLVQAGVVYILPAAVGLDSGASLRFNDDPSDDVLAALPSADSAVLLLSGSDPALVDAVMNHSWGGALVAGQAADGCYDAAAPNALAARGGDTAPPAKLALRLAERWSSRGTEDVQA